MDYSLQADEIRELQRRKKFYEDNPPMCSLPSKPVEYTDEDREQFEHDRFVFINDERQTYA